MTLSSHFAEAYAPLRRGSIISVPEKYMPFPGGGYDIQRMFGAARSETNCVFISGQRAVVGLSLTSLPEQLRHFPVPGGSLPYDFTDRHFSRLRIHAGLHEDAHDMDFESRLSVTLVDSLKAKCIIDGDFIRHMLMNVMERVADAYAVGMQLHMLPADDHLFLRDWMDYRQSDLRPDHNTASTVKKIFIRMRKLPQGYFSDATVVDRMRDMISGMIAENLPGIVKEQRAALLASHALAEQYDPIPCYKNGKPRFIVGLLGWRGKAQAEDLANAHDQLDAARGSRERLARSIEPDYALLIHAAKRTLAGKHVPRATMDYAGGVASGP